MLGPDAGKKGVRGRGEKGEKGTRERKSDRKVERGRVREGRKRKREMGG